MQVPDSHDNLLTHYLHLQLVAVGQQVLLEKFLEGSLATVLCAHEEKVPALKDVLDVHNEVMTD